MSSRKANGSADTSEWHNTYRAVVVAAIQRSGAGALPSVDGVIAYAKRVADDGELSAAELTTPKPPTHTPTTTKNGRSK